MSTPEIEYQITDEETLELLNFLRGAEFTVQNTPQSYREINHYEKEGLLISQRESTKGWRRFKVNELIWFHIIEELRKFGFPLKKIKVLREQLFGEQSNDLKSDESVDFLEFLMTLCLKSHNRFFIVVFPNGKSTFFSEEHLFKVKDTFIDITHIQVPLTPIIKQIWESIPDKQFIPKVSHTFPDYEKIREIVDLILSGEFEKLTINFKGKKPFSLEGKVKEEVNKKLIDLVKENPFQDVTIKTENKQVIHIEKTVKRKL